ncbi:8008_t:CDS:2, partial [Cetraspora pellucida]
IFQEYEIDKAWSLTLFIQHLRKICNLAYAMNSYLKVHFSTEADEMIKKSNLFRMQMLFNSEEEYFKMEALMFGSLAGSTNPSNVRIPQATMDVLERNEHPEDTLHIAEGGMISIEEHRMLLQ